MQDSNSTSLLISWNHLRPYFASGTVKGFIITITNNRGQQIKNETVQGLTEERTISYLTEYTEYCITVKAVTNVGLGDVSDELCAFTDEDGK